MRIRNIAIGTVLAIVVLAITDSVYNDHRTHYLRQAYQTVQIGQTKQQVLDDMRYRPSYDGTCGHLGAHATKCGQELDFQFEWLMNYVIEFDANGRVIRKVEIDSP